MKNLQKNNPEKKNNRFKKHQNSKINQKMNGKIGNSTRESE